MYSLLSILIKEMQSKGIKVGGLIRYDLKGRQKNALTKELYFQEPLCLILFF